MKSPEQWELHNAVLTEDIDRFRESVAQTESEMETFRNANDAMQKHIERTRTQLMETLRQVDIHLMA